MPAMSNLVLPEELLQRLHTIGKADKQEPPALILLAVREYVERKEHHAGMKVETLEGLSDLEAGRVVDGDRVLEWISSWGSENELAVPRS